MGFLTPDSMPHRCKMPDAAAAYAEGTRWQCDACSTVYRVEFIRDRGIAQREWVEQPITAREILDGVR